MIYGGETDFDDLAAVVEQTTRALRPHVGRFDSIVVTGVSGMAVGFPVSLALGVPLVVRRKDFEDSHGIRGELINRHRLGKRVLFLDDVVSTGQTYARCADTVKRAGAMIVGAYTYHNGGVLAIWGTNEQEKPHWAKWAEKKRMWF